MLQQISTTSAEVRSNPRKRPTAQAKTLEVLCAEHREAVAGYKAYDSARLQARFSAQATFPKPPKLIDATDPKNLEGGITKSDARWSPKQGHFYANGIAGHLNKLTREVRAKSTPQPDGSILIEYRETGEPFEKPDMTDPLIVRMQERLKASREYEAECERIMEAAGCADTNLEDDPQAMAFEATLDRLERKICRARASTLAELALKSAVANAQIARGCGEIRDDYSIALSVLDDILRLKPGAH